METLTCEFYAAEKVLEEKLDADRGVTHRKSIDLFNRCWDLWLIPNTISVNIGKDIGRKGGT